MSRPPIKALESIQNYCKKTQCRRCYFGYRYKDPVDYVGCMLQDNNPCDWQIPKEDENERS